jgi:hypothetical protein
MDLPADLEPFSAAIAILAAVPDETTRQWYPAGHPSGLRIPFAPAHRHPTVLRALTGSVHWDGIVPRYPCLRLDLTHPVVAPLAPALRTIAAVHLAADDALYIYALTHRSEHRNHHEAFDRLSALLRAAR